MIYFETDYAGETYDLVHPRILWNSVARRSTVIASTQAAGHPGTNAATATTYDTWKPTEMPATWRFTFDETETVNALAIDTHTLGTSGATVAVQEWGGLDWVDIVSGTPVDDTPIAFLFYARTLNAIRINITGDTIPSIAVIHCCKAIECPQRVYMGAPTPVNLAFKTEFETNQSAGGNYLGRTVKRQKNVNSFTLSHVKEYWVNNTLLPFIEDAIEYPYFLLERPYDLPNALSYRWQQVDITPVRMGVKSYMQVDL